MNEHWNLQQDERKSAPLVSVVIDTCNHEAFIGEAITSVLQQEYQLGAVEVLVVDDGSRDGTAKQLSAFTDRVRIVRKENAGQASALNLGVTLAKGDIIAFLDGGDWWHPRKLQAVVGTTSCEIPRWGWWGMALSKWQRTVVGVRCGLGS
jgi:glycosyltransferase involved in cell wall biosynthesis